MLLLPAASSSFFCSSRFASLKVKLFLSDAIQMKLKAIKHTITRFLCVALTLARLSCPSKGLHNYLKNHDEILTIAPGVKPFFSLYET